AQRGHPQPGVVDDAPGGLHADLAHRLAPQPDRGQPRGGGALDGLAEAPVRGGALVEREPGEPRVAGGGRVDPRRGPARDVEGGHRTAPATLSRLRIRAAAASGSGNSRAALASANTSDRCTTDRADCSPPTIVNPGWCPQSHDRNAMPVL